jgi:hypothetical protein
MITMTSDGVVLGDKECKNWERFLRIEEKTCCGGRVKKLAIIQCKILGEVQAVKCRRLCKERVM